MVDQPTADAKVELVARALCELQVRRARKWDTPSDKLEEMLQGAVDYAWPNFREEAHAAITALEASHSLTEAITPEMLSAGIDAYRENPPEPRSHGELVEAIYAAMQDARPIAPETVPTDATKRMAKTMGCDFVPRSIAPVQDYDAITIFGKGPNDPAMMLCAKLAECGVAVEIRVMREALARLGKQPLGDGE